MGGSASGINGTDNATVLENTAVTYIVYYGEAVIQPTILLVGIITNTISIFILLGAHMTPNLRICIVSLTISDLLATIAGFCQVIVEVAVYGGDIPYGWWQAPAIASNTLYYIYMMFMCSSASLVILLVALRCLLVLRPVASRQFLTAKRTRWLCMGTFIFAFVVYLPTSLNVIWQVCFNDAQTNEYCNKTFTEMPNLKAVANGYLYSLTIIFYPILTLIYVISFILIRVTLKEATKNMPSLMQRQGSSEAASRHRSSITSRITKTLLFILVLDTLCTLPTGIQAIWLIINPTGNLFDSKRSPLSEVFDVLAEIILCLRPTYNFWLYAFTHADFQVRGKEVLLMIQHKCRCFMLGIMRIPSTETVSRTESTAVPNDGSIPASPTAKKVARLTPLSAHEQHILQKQLTLEKAEGQNGNPAERIITAL